MYNTDIQGVSRVSHTIDLNLMRVSGSQTNLFIPCILSGFRNCETNSLAAADIRGKKS